MNYISYEEWKKDDLIISKDDEIVNMYIVLKGKVKISAYPPSEVNKVAYLQYTLSVDRNLKIEANTI